MLCRLMVYVNSRLAPRVRAHASIGGLSAALAELKKASCKRAGIA